jgi:hypothetical protein
MVQTPSDSSLCVPLGDLDHLKSLQWSLVITYVSSVFSELNSPVGTYVVTNLAQSDILKISFLF